MKEIKLDGDMNDKIKIVGEGVIRHKTFDGILFDLKPISQDKLRDNPDQFAFTLII